MKESLISEIHNYLSQELQEVNQIIISSSNPSEELVGMISDHLINSGGKRIRPIVHLLSARAFGCKSIHLAAALEFVHAATLLHDDVIDESDTRRGRSTANFLWGNAASILVGDFLFSQSFKLMVSAGSIKAMDLLSSASAKLAEGEVMQLKRLGNIFDKEEYYRIISAKTAELFAASASSAAAIAGASDEDIFSMGIFGLNLGLIFQIRDDFLDYFGDFSRMGKNLGQDFRESKCTLPIIFAMENVDDAECEFLKKSFANEIEQDFEEVVRILKNLDIEQKIEKEVKLLEIEALRALESVNLYSKEKEFLYQILLFAAQRMS